MRQDSGQRGGKRYVLDVLYSGTGKIVLSERLVLRLVLDTRDAARVVAKAE